MAGPADLVGLFDVFLDTVKNHKAGISTKPGNNNFTVFFPHIYSLQLIYVHKIIFIDVFFFLQ